MNTPAPLSSPDRRFDREHEQRPAEISLADQQAFEAASLRLRQALQDAGGEERSDDVAEARQSLRSIAVKLRDAGFWRSDKQGLRTTVSLLWEADRHVNDKALLGHQRDRVQN
ncbi:hypothetical protein [Blastomonas sp.]|uniref:hypothetical protein n=1 Tax=Blastomonas sp. TaxID=1909299 RepID=UPI002621EE64|nr:hypothetical protein [Blastomonas sp.]MDM7956230.1 hypothetical protein [Blastomonas sp.]